MSFLLPLSNCAVTPATFTPDFTFVELIPSSPKCACLCKEKDRDDLLEVLKRCEAK